MTVIVICKHGEERGRPESRRRVLRLQHDPEGRVVEQRFQWTRLDKIVVGDLLEGLGKVVEVQA